MSPTVYGVTPGSDFVLTLFEHLKTLNDPKAPEKLARAKVLVPTRRMQRRLKYLFENEGAHLLPKIGLVSDVSHLFPEHVTKPPTPKLLRILQLKAVVSKLVELDQRLNQNAVIDLSESLASLLDEMQGEGVSFSCLSEINTGDLSGHWQQSLEFLSAIQTYSENINSEYLDTEARQRQITEQLVEHWKIHPTEDPVIVAGSTGSRATTRLLMAAVSRLPHGQVVLPGFDFCLDQSIWETLNKDRSFEEHPQFRFASFLDDLGLDPSALRKLGKPTNNLRNQLISLSLHPAPVTGSWLSEGPKLGDLSAATDHLTLVEAQSPKDEARSIAIAMKRALDQEKTVALISPDATLARRVTSELARWGLIPDDSGGMPLSLSPAGRFLRHILNLIVDPQDPVALLSLLKHPFCQRGERRGPHMRLTQEFELYLRSRRVLQISSIVIQDFAAKTEDAEAWCAWLIGILDDLVTPEKETLNGNLSLLTSTAKAFHGDGAYLETEDQSAVDEVVGIFSEATLSDAALSFNEFAQLFEKALASESVRQQTGVRTDLMIWGTLEARVQGADVVILGSLNEGTWPEQPAADPWLNRSMRRKIGLLLPERQIGLAAHDYQQAVAAKEVILTRSNKVEGSETVPSRWLSRLTNLLKGLEGSAKSKSLAGMQDRGDRLLATATRLDAPNQEMEPASRPAPAPPVSSRPKTFAVTEVKRLIQDPYAVYAKRILRLKPLDPLAPEVDARLKGTVFHRILELFFKSKADYSNIEAAKHRLEEISSDVITSHVPFPALQVEWISQMSANAHWLIAEEIKRRELGSPAGFESKGLYQVPGTVFELRGMADRIDRLTNGDLIIYDYKTGTPPTLAEIKNFDRQLVLEAVMAEAGAFKDIATATVEKVVHIGVGRTPSTRITKLVDDNDTVTVSGQIADLLTAFASERTGFVSRRAMEKVRFAGDYDHLARFGEWDASQEASVEALK